MDVTIQPLSLSGEVAAISSKSVAHRILMAAALSDQPTQLRCNTSCADIEATIRCLRALGAHIISNTEGFEVSPLSFPAPRSQCRCELDCHESGTTFRFMLPVAAAYGRPVAFTGAKRLAERPIGPLAEALEQAGVCLKTPGSFPLFCQGALQSWDVSLPGNVSSQYLSGFLLAASAARHPLTLDVLGTIESASYVRLTLDILALFGQDVTIEHSKVGSIPKTRFYHSGKALKSPRELNVEGDWSNAAFWLCAAALGSKPITVEGLNLKSAQGDAAVLGLLEAFGAKVVRGEASVTVVPGHLHAIDFSAADIPDLIPVLSLVAARAQGTSRISNCGRLRLKECDRLQATIEALQKLGVPVSLEGDSLLISGVKSFKATSLNSHNDHRMAMMAAVASVCAQGPIVIHGAEAVAKSYPHFFDDFAHLGASYATTKEDR